MTFARVAEASPYLVLDLADNAFRVYGRPAMSFVKENVVVMKVAVQEPNFPLRRAEVRVQVLSLLDERGRELFISAC